MQGWRVATKWNAVQKDELSAIIGVLLLARAEKNWDVDVWHLLLDHKLNPTYKACFGVNRFENIRRNLQFDDKRTRVERLNQDKLAAFSYIWGLFIENCKTQFSLGAYTTIDEQLVPFRGLCPFLQYMPNKPAKYGIKIFWLYDASLTYASNARIYVGRQPGSEPEKNLGQNKLFNKHSHYKALDGMWQWITILQVLRWQKQYSNVSWQSFGPWRSAKEKFQSVWYLQSLEKRRHRSLVSTTNSQWSITSSKKNKAVILLSTMYHEISIDEEDHKKRPEIIKFYNKTKIGVDLADQMVGTCTCRRQTLRWPLKFFFNLLDVVALNAYTIYKQVHPDQQSTGSSRRRFLTDFADSLILPHMKARQKILQLQKATK